jgi:hypothetical protein
VVRSRSALFMAPPTSATTPHLEPAFQMGLLCPYAESVQAVKTIDLPAGTNSDSNTYASRANTDAYARAIATTIVAGATVVAGASIVAWCIAARISILNDHASPATSAVAAAILVADQSNIFDVVIGQHRKALR